MGVSMISFASIAYLTNNTFIIVVTMLSRCFQGVAASMIRTTAFAITTSIYSQEQEKYLGMIEASVAFGCLIGPAFGSFLYNLAGFEGTFFIVGSLFITLFPILIMVVPSSVDAKEEMLPNENVDSAGEILLPVTYAKLFGDKIYTMNAFAASIAFFSY
jgi:MFS family permease